MTIAVGDKIPDVELRRMGKREPESLRSLDVLGHGKVVLFGFRALSPRRARTSTSQASSCGRRI